MDLTYKVRGADGKEYGPVSLDTLTAWFRESRISPHSEVMRSDMSYWSQASAFTELQSILAPATPEPVAVASSPSGGRSASTTDPALVAQMKSGAGWFYWIAGLSLVNSFAAFTGSGWRFVLGLGITQFVIDRIGHSLQGSGKVIALALDLLAAGVLILFGIMGSKGHTWAFIVGLVLFALDGIIFLIAQDWIGVAFHAFVLYCLFRGLKACREFKAV